MLPMSWEIFSFFMLWWPMEKRYCVAQCQALNITIQGHSITIDYYLLYVAACQLVLGYNDLKLSALLREITKS